MVVPTLLPAPHPLLLRPWAPWPLLPLQPPLLPPMPREGQS
jgi:hypothetical protein